MWKPTRIKNTFTTKKGTVMVSFEEKSDDGRNWAAPLGLVKKGLGRHEMQPGLAVRIRIDGGKISEVERDRKALLPNHPPATTPCPAATPSENPGTTQAGTSTRLPYGFVPIDTSSSITDTPVWHDGSHDGDDELLSGEILCTLEALTPLLPGNARYPIRKDGKENGTELADLARLGWDSAGLKAGKQIAEPLRLPDGRVVIAGSALKGMIRHSLGALLSAPMERVVEHSYSYRPNLEFIHPNIELARESRPAIVENWDQENDALKLKVLPSEAISHVLFVRNRAVTKLNTSAGALQGNIRGIKRCGPRNQRLDTDSHGMENLTGYRYYKYAGGVDGKGYLAKAFSDGGSVYSHVLVRETDVNSSDPMLVPANVLAVHDKTVSHLIDEQIGHLHSGHPLARKEYFKQNRSGIISGIKESHNVIRTAGYLVFVEVSESNGGGKILSIGQNYRYRWRYSDTVCEQNWARRPVLSPLECERKFTDHGAPEKLSGARLLFGYVRDEENLIGQGIYERLAGRIAVNHAVSVGKPDFLGKEPDYCVPLKILGQPKSSAWEFYLQQPKIGALVTYGDLPGEVGGELAGRKFYRHQPSCGIGDIRTEDDETVKSDQATLARFICAKGTQFKFTLRFARLRPWELGAVLAVLEPQRLAGTINGGPKQYAHKLGLGRPLGMGSVAIKVDTLRLRSEKDCGLVVDKEKESSAMAAITTKLAACNTSAWLEAHEFANLGRLAYPTVETIYAWHTNLRRKYSKLRRQKDPNWNDLHAEIDKANPR